MQPLDPSENWLATGITGLPRQREWDAVTTAETPGTPGDEVSFVRLLDGRLVVETAPAAVDAGALAASLEGAIEPPYRALALRKEDVWAVGATAIEVLALDPDPRGDDLELTWDGSSHSLLVDGLPADPAIASPLERLAAERQAGAYSASAHRLEGNLFEMLVLAL